MHYTIKSTKKPTTPGTVQVPGHSIGDGSTRHLVELKPGDTADNPSSATEPIRGPGFVVYDVRQVAPGRTDTSTRRYANARGFYDAVEAPAKMVFMGLTEIAALFDARRQNAFDWAKAQSFPQPYQELSQGRIWERSAIVAWGRETGRGTGDEGSDVPGLLNVKTATLTEAEVMQLAMNAHEEGRPDEAQRLLADRLAWRSEVQDAARRSRRPRATRS